MVLIRLFFVFIFVSYQPVFGNNLPVSENSYQKILEATTDKESRISLIQEYIKLYHKSNDTKIRAQIGKAFDFAENRYTNEVFPLEIYRIIGTEYYVKKNYIKYIEYNYKLITQCVEGKDDYIIHSSYYSIGLVKTYLEDYKQAMDDFTRSADYFEKHTSDYNYLMGYVNSKRYQAICAFYLGNYELSEQYLNEGYQILDKLKPDDLYYDKAYYDLVKGITLYASGKYSESEQLLHNALEPIRKNEDFANEGLIYKYLALNSAQHNDFEMALQYNLKVDDLFNNHHYSSLQLATVYSSIIDYYKNKDNLKQQLAYTNQHLAVINFLRRENKYIQTLIHRTFDTYALEKEKNRLENELRAKRKNLFLSSFTGILIVSTLCFLAIKYYRKNKQQSVTVESQKTIPQKKDISPSVIEEIKTKLDEFEYKQGFLKEKINIDKLAKQLGTNRTYLTTCIHQHKGMMFNDYLNNLRIEHLLIKWEKEPEWRNYKFSEIARQLGFTNSRSFSIAFNKHQNQSPSQYLHQLNKEEETILVSK